MGTETRPTPTPAPVSRRHRTRVTIALDIDPDAWRAEYGYAAALPDIVALVQSDARAAVAGHFQTACPDAVSVVVL